MSPVVRRQADHHRGDTGDGLCRQPFLPRGQRHHRARPDARPRHRAGGAGRADRRVLLRLLGDADPLRLPVRPLRAAPHRDRHAGGRGASAATLFTLAPTWPHAAGRPRADGRGLRRHADRQHGGDLALVPARPLLHAGRRWCCRSACSATCSPPRRWPGAPATIGWRGVFGADGRLHRAGHDRRLAGRARRAAGPSLPRAQDRRPPREMLRGLGEVLRNPQLQVHPRAQFLQLRLHLHRAGPVGRPVPARGARADARSRPATCCWSR